MKTNLHSARVGRASGLTLLEMLVATTLLVVIVLGLTAMFLQTQRAFRGGITQTDVLGGGQTVVDMMARDFQQMSDAKDTNVVNFFRKYWYEWNQNDGKGNVRTNYLTDMFALEHINNIWYGVGYAISNAVNGGANTGTPLVGTLYRYLYTTNDVPSANPCMLFTNEVINGSFPSNDFQPVIDGVIHMRLRAFDANGMEITNSLEPTVLTLPGDFPSNGIPNSVELELGILEPAVLEQVRAFGTNLVAQQSFLTNRMGAVHIFREQIPVRAALPR